MSIEFSTDIVMVNHIKLGTLAVLPPLAAAVSCTECIRPQKPNVLLIVADDLGMGDVSAYGSKTISTPNIDSLSDAGIRFDNAYSTSATSTPSRYGMFTGMYPWRQKVQILNGDAPLLIPVDMPTLPKMMQKAGYSTAAIGKWHLGMGKGNVDWNRPVSPSANDVGFDYTCVIAATNDRVPTVYVENGLVEGLDPDDPIEVSYTENFAGEPTALTNPELLKMTWHHGHNNSIVNGIPRIGFMKGGNNARWVDEEMADYFVGKVKEYIDAQGDKPFFLYYGLHEPHVPRAPHQRFVGTSGLGPRGDAVIEADWCVGEVISYLREKGILDNTIVIFTSDNGPVLNDGYNDFVVELAGEHDPFNGMRGGKYSLFDGGTHVPMIVAWGRKLDPGVSDAFVSQLDLFASLGEIVGGEVPEGLDSRQLSEAFLGHSDEGRLSMVLEAQGRLAYRKGDYVLIPPYEGPQFSITGNELGNLPGWSLFDLTSDPGQQHDLSGSCPEILEEMKQEFLAGYEENVGKFPDSFTR